MIPVLYESGFVSIQTLWVFVAIGLLVSSYVAVKSLKRRRLDLTLFIENSGFFLLWAVLFSRFIYFFANPGTYFPALDLRTIGNFLSIWDQGFSFWGALVGFTAAMTFTLWRRGENIWKWYDALIVPLLIGMAIGYLGAFLGGYSYGEPTNLPWGIRYEVINVKYTVPVHPTQIYSIAVLMLILWSKKILKAKSHFFDKDGNTTIYITMLLSLGMFLLEFLRGDDTLIAFDTFRIAQFFFFGLFLFSLILLLRRLKA